MQRPRPLSPCPSRLRLVPSLLGPSMMLLALAGLPAGCESPSEGGPDAGPDLSARCVLPYDQRAIDLVSMGAITVAPEPGDPSTFTAQIDATAGGFANAGKNSFVYLDLVGGKKVELTDLQAEQSGAWDMAFKRAQIKLNGGDSGPGMVGAAVVTGKTLAEVTSAPAGPYATDSYFDAKCMVQLDDIGGLTTALDEWYDYDMNMVVIPKKEVIVLTRRDQKGHIKVQITAYYKGMAGANYQLSWSLLP